MNVLELMPVSNVKEDVEWGDIHRVYFAPDDRYGGPEGMKRPLCNRPGPSGVSVLVGGGEPG